VRSTPVTVVTGRNKRSLGETHKMEERADVAQLFISRQGIFFYEKPAKDSRAIEADSYLYVRARMRTVAMT